MSESYLAGNGAIFVQPLGPNTEPKYLGCHALGDVDEPQGDLTLVYCPDASRPNQFKVDTSFKGEAGAITTSIETLMRRTADYLETLQEGGILFVNMVDKGRKDLFTNRGRGFALDAISITTKGGSNWSVRDPGSQESALMTFDISAEAMYRYHTLFATRKAMTTEEIINAIGAYGVTLPCEMLVLGFAAATGATPEVYLSTDFGANFAVTTTDPFAIDQDISSAKIFGIGTSTVRILLTRDAVVAVEAEAAYSDDCGESWTMVDMGIGVDEGIVKAGGLEVHDQAHIWAVGKGGAIYFSSQGGAIWEVQAEKGDITASNLNVVKFLNEQVGFAAGVSAAVVKTIDGGIVWEDISADVPAIGDILSLAITPNGTVWLGSNDGSLVYASEDDYCGTGLAWHQRAYPEKGVKSVENIIFMNDLIGWMTAGKIIYRTVDGGFNWEIVDAAAAYNITQLVVCDTNRAWAAGEVHDLTSTLLSISS